MARAAALTVGIIAISTETAGAQDRLNFVGAVNVSEAGGGPNVLLDFLNPILAVHTVSGAFLGEITPFVTTGTISDVEISPLGCANCPVAPFVTMGGYAFTLTATPLAPAGPFNFGPIQLTQNANGTAASLSVVGTVVGGDYATPQTFQGIFTAQFVGETPFQVFTSIDQGGTRNVGFSAEFVVGVVPEPSTYALMATGILAIVGSGIVRRRNRA